MSDRTSLPLEMTNQPLPPFGHFHVATHPDGSPWELGRGAMGVTYKAHDSLLRVDVALKVINPAQMGHAKVQALFTREARAAARVHHSNVASVVYLNPDPANPYYAMEFIAGESLRDWMRTRGPLRPLLAIGLAEQIALGLEAIHSEHVVHRDLKPGNVMIVRTARGKEANASEDDAATWQVKIIDFGLARAFTGDELSSNAAALTTGFRGTAAYASPEQCQERPDLDGRSDLYSLGCILWEMLIGTPPFRGNSLHDLLTLHVSRPAPVQMLGRFPTCLQAVVARLLVKDPDGRFANGAAVATALAQCRERITSGAEAEMRPDVASTLETALADKDIPPSRSVAIPTPNWAKPPRSRQMILGALLVVVAGGFVASVAFWRSRSENSGGMIATAPTTKAVGTVPLAPEATHPPDKSIAVLPFENLSATPENSFFADGMQDQILTDLSRLSDLRVTARSSVMRYRDTSARDTKIIARDLGVAYLLEGTVQRAGNAIRVTVQLIDPQTRSQVWAEKYDRNLTDVFAIQSEIATAIAAQLKARLTPAERAVLNQPPTTDLAAYDLYLKARALEQSQAGFKLEVSPESRKEVVALLEQAVSRDPTFVQAFCMLVRVSDQIASGSEGEDEKLFRAKAETSLASATRLSPDSADVLLAQAEHAYSGLNDDRTGRELATKVLKIAPSNADAWMLLGRINCGRNHWETGLDCFRRAYLLSPNDLRIIEPYMQAAYGLRRYGLMRALADRGANIATPPARWSFESIAAATEGFIHGDLKPHRKVLDQIRKENPGPETERALQLFLTRLAQSERNLPEIERLAVLFPTPPPVDFEGQDRAVWQTIWAAQVRGDEATIRETARAFFPELDAAIREKNGVKSEQLAELLSEAGIFNALAGNKDDAIRLGKQACEMFPLNVETLEGAQRVGDLARIYALLGETELALSQLEIVTKLPWGPSYLGLLVNTDWDHIRSDSRFQTFLSKMAKRASEN